MGTTHFVSEVGTICLVIIYNGSLINSIWE